MLQPSGKTFYVAVLQIELCVQPRMNFDCSDRNCCCACRSRFICCAEQSRRRRSPSTPFFDKCTQSRDLLTGCAGDFLLFQTASVDVPPILVLINSPSRV